ncbi:tetratricopeptide repeat protein, partial [Pseudomonas fulva]|uniref:tetratricopeptide repeat protein n=1 Tax=Pseudomonas fulva TaxID=47880 RepID=UPI0034D7980F
SHFYLGSMAYQDGDHDAAVEHLNKAERHDHPEALNLLGDVQLHAERYPQAEQAYRRAAELGNDDGYNNLGLLYLQLEDYQQA